MNYDAIVRNFGKSDLKQRSAQRPPSKQEVLGWTRGSSVWRCVSSLCGFSPFKGTTLCECECVSVYSLHGHRMYGSLRRLTRSEASVRCAHKQLPFISGFNFVPLVCSPRFPSLLRVCPLTSSQPRHPEVVESSLDFPSCPFLPSFFSSSCPPLGLMFPTLPCSPLFSPLHPFFKHFSHLFLPKSKICRLIQLQICACVFVLICVCK